MKTIQLLAGTLAISSLTLVSCMKPMSEVVTDTNSGFNGGFESFTNDLPVNWQCYTAQTTGGNFKIIADKTNFKEGKQALLFDVTACEAAGGRLSPGIAREIPAKAGQTFTISYWVKSTGNKFKVKINGITETESDKGIEMICNDTLNEWKRFETTYTIPSNMKDLRIEINVLSPGKFWLDDVVVR